MKQKSKDIVKGAFIGSGITIFVIYLIIKKLRGSYKCKLDCKKNDPVIIDPKIKN